MLPCARTCAFLLAICSVACGAGRGTDPLATERNRPLLRPLEVYHKLGFMAGTAEFPAVAQVATLDGPADSTFVVLSVSIPNSALRFHRNDAGFEAAYRVRAVLASDGVQTTLDRREQVQVPSYAETSRTDESVIFQDVMTVRPGTYTLQLDIDDLNSARALHAQDTIIAPDYPGQRQSSEPLIVYQAGTRNDPAARPDFIVNPRSTVAYGAGATIYLEQYGTQAGQPVPLRVVDEAGATLWSGAADMMAGNAKLRSATVQIPAESLSIGGIWIEAEADGVMHRLPLLVTISDAWLVSNYDEVLQFLRYIAYPAELDSLRDVAGKERRRLWEGFWTRRDSNPATSANEFRDEFFRRVRSATEEFNEPGRPGWKTERGEVFIVLGPPAYIKYREVGSEGLVRPDLIEWGYDLPGVSRDFVLRFIDTGGLGRFELTPASRNTFVTAAHRLRPRS